MPSAPTLLQNVIARGIVADRPVAGLAGRLWYATDESTFYRDNGTTWDELPTGAVDSVDGLTGAVDLTGTYLTIDDAAATYLTPGAADAAYDAIGAADAAVDAHVAAVDPHGDRAYADGLAINYDAAGTAAAAVTAHDTDPAAHTGLFDAAGTAAAAVAAHDIDPAAHNGIEAQVSNKANAFKPTAPIEYNIYSTLASRANVTPDTSYEDLFAQAPLAGGETPEGGWSIAVFLSADDSVDIDVRTTVFEVGTGTPYTATKTFTEGSPSVDGESGFVLFEVADFDFGVTPAPSCDEVQIEWAVPGGETVGIYSAYAMMSIPGEGSPAAYIVDVEGAVAAHVAESDPHPQYLTETEADAIYIQQIEKGAALGVATLDGSGLIPTDQLPGLALTSTFVVGGELAMLALDAQTGDIAVRTDLGKTFVLAGTDPTVLADWQELITPTDVVTSVDGLVGAVDLSSTYVGTGDSRLTDARTPTPAAYAALEAERYGKANTLSTFIMGTYAGTTTTLISGRAAGTGIRPHRDMTIAQLSTVLVSAGAGTTLFKMGVYSVTGSASTWTLTLVGKTANITPVVGYNSGVIEGGPITLTAGNHYVFAVLWIGTTGIQMWVIGSSGGLNYVAANYALVEAMGYGSTGSTWSSLTDLSTPLGNATGQISNRLWIRAEE